MSSQNVKHKTRWNREWLESVASLPQVCAVQCRLRIVMVQNPLPLAPSFLIALVSLAHADSASQMLKEMSRCSAIADAAERLRCYDTAAPRAGTLAPQADDFGRPAPTSPQLAQLSANVREFWKTSRGLAVFVLDNGQTWRQIEADGTPLLEPLAGTTFKVTIEPGLLNSYNLMIEGRNGLIKVRRIQ